MDEEHKVSPGILSIGSLSEVIFVICPFANDSGMLNSQCACSNELGSQKQINKLNLGTKIHQLYNFIVTSIIEILFWAMSLCTEWIKTAQFLIQFGVVHIVGNWKWWFHLILFIRTIWDSCMQVPQPSHFVSASLTHYLFSVLFYSISFP